MFCIGVMVKLQEGTPLYINSVSMHNVTKKKCIYSQRRQIRQVAENARWNHSNFIFTEVPAERTPLANQENMIATSTIRDIYSILIEFKYLNLLTPLPTSHRSTQPHPQTTPRPTNDPKPSHNPPQEHNTTHQHPI